MAGGLIELNKTVNNKQTFLINNESGITFFKCVYVRRSYFSVESIPVNFDTFVNFGTTATVELPKTGDLMNKMYIQVTLPKIIIESKEYIDSDFLIVKEYLKMNRKAIKKSYSWLACDNVNDINCITSDIKDFCKYQSTEFKNLLKKTPYKYTDISVYEICLASADIAMFKSKIDFANKISGYVYSYFSKVKPKDKYTWPKDIGNKLVKEVTIYIGEQRIDRQYGEWLSIWFELFNNASLRKAYNRMIGHNINSSKKNILFIPLQFWFNQNIANSLNLLGLGKQRIRCEVEFESAQNLGIPCNASICANLLIDYIFLEPLSKKVFLADSIIPIEQLEVMIFPASENNICILDNFNKPSKELIWGIFPQSCNIKSSSIKYNDYDRVPELDNTFYNYVIPYYYHTNSPKININVYPFALYPEKVQPSGLSDLKLIPKITLKIDLSTKPDIGQKIFVFSRVTNYLITTNGYTKLRFV